MYNSILDPKAQQNSCDFSIEESQSLDQADIALAAIIANANAKLAKQFFKRKRTATTEPMAWLKPLVNPRLIGKQVGNAVFPNLNKSQFVDSWNVCQRVSGMTNTKLAAHFASERTHYFQGNGSPNARFTLVMIDIDVLKAFMKGSKAGAVAFAKRLATLLSGLYFEVSTHGNGVHCYFLLDKLGMTAEQVNALLKGFERWLRQYAKEVSADIEQVEIKGLCPILHFADESVLSAVQYGSFAKLPRDVSRFSEWESTTVLTASTISEQFFVAKADEATVDELVASIDQEHAKTTERRIVSGSISGKLFDELDIAAITKYEAVFRKVLAKQIDTKQRATTANDLSILAAILRKFKLNPNADGSLPVRRIKAIWDALFKAGEVSRGFSYNRMSQLRNWLSDNGHIDWIDNTYMPPAGDTLGRACRWSITESFADWLDELKDATAVQIIKLASAVPKGTGKALRPSIMLMDRSTVLDSDVEFSDYEEQLADMAL